MSEQEIKDRVKSFRLEFGIHTDCLNGIIIEYVTRANAILPVKTFCFENLTIKCEC